MNGTAGYSPNDPAGNTSNTHFQQNGTDIITRLVIGAIKSSSNARLKVLADERE